MDSPGGSMSGVANLFDLGLVFIVGLLIARSGPHEIASLIKELSGRYIPPGQGNDPVRNPQSLPTGRNFYGFNPGKMPSPAHPKGYGP